MVESQWIEVSWHFPVACSRWQLSAISSGLTTIPEVQANEHLNKRAEWGFLQKRRQRQGAQ